MAKVFFSYTHKDEELRDRLEVSLKMLQRQGLIETWHDRRIIVGDELDRAISDNLEAADVILLLVSPDFLASDYCYDVELARALERHRAGEAVVIPVILRHCDWHAAPFGKLLATPTDGKPIRAWADLDEAFQVVTVAIRKALEAKGSAPQADPFRNVQRNVPPSAMPVRGAGPRSSNLAVSKRFSDRDRDQFLEEAYAYIERFFDNSLEELKMRHTDVDTSFRQISGNRFSAKIYRHGKEVSRCWVTLGEEMGKGISYSQSERNGFNEQLRVDSDEQGLFLRSMGMSIVRTGGRDQKMTYEGGAELLWDMLISPLQYE
ncbi:toll/interleukin-1 receptor domain-containing protein [Tianweitania sp.]|uniref:toll/interleukin-1 receptor domain-containing protein n=1 Tax=Tianweitania sp. TaxID=2021634 RepID=UPI00289F3124|nr:toll/interleukin-1 receptor domain-containing protein [Tianweitania sp.]